MARPLEVSSIGSVRRPRRDHAPPRSDRARWPTTLNGTQMSASDFEGYSATIQQRRAEAGDARALVPNDLPCLSPVSDGGNGSPRSLDGENEHN